MKSTTIFLVNVKDDIIDTDLELFKEKCIIAMNYKTKESNSITPTLIELKNRIYMETYVDNDAIILILHNHNDEEKKKILRKLSRDEDVIDIKVLFDTLSNKAIIENYPLLIKLENTLRKLTLLLLSNNRGKEVFQIIESLNTKDDIRDYIKAEKPNTNLNLKLQRYELKNLTKFIKEKHLGGDEISIYKEFFKDCYNEETKDSDDARIKEFIKKLNEDVFKDVKKILDDQKMINDYRNSICHNRCIDVEIFNEKYKKWIKSRVEELEELYKTLLQEYGILSVNGCKYLDNNMEKIHMMIKFKKKNINDNFYKLILNKMLNEIGLLYDAECVMVEENRIIYNKNDNIYIEMMGNETSELLMLFLAIKPNNKEEILYYSDSEVCKNNATIEIIREKLIDFFEEELMFITDDLSERYCKDIFADINYIENSLRAYITLYKNMEGLNKTKNKINPSDLHLIFNEKCYNEYFELDFIELLDIIQNSYINERNLNNERQEMIKNLKSNNIDEISKKLENMIEYDDKIIEIAKNWPDLYTYRTIVAHNGFILEDEYKKIKQKCNKIKFIIENLIVEYFMENFIKFKYTDTKNKNIEILDLGNLQTVKIKILNEGSIRKFHIEDMNILNIYRIASLLMEPNHELFLNYYIFSEYLINKKINEMDEYLQNNDDLRDKFMKVNEYLQYSDHLKERNIENQQDELEELIGVLLKEVTDKINVNKSELLDIV